MNSTEPRRSWIVCQIGARENYNIARALSREHALRELITERWTAPGSVIGKLLPRLAERHHDDIEDGRVFAPTLKSLSLEAISSLQQLKGWNRIVQRNRQFDQMAARRLLETAHTIGNQPVTVFAYSYAAAETFRTAKSLGWQTILGQIDPGPEEARIVRALYEEAGQDRFYEIIPDDYWLNWRNEISLADKVIVNSNWTRDALIKSGVVASKMERIPLAFEPKASLAAPQRDTPKAFDKARPLRALFLGQVTLRKGVGQIFDAIKALQDFPIQVDFVGEIQVDIPAHIHNDERVTFHGTVSRHQVGEFYRSADVFLFPTLSDGFGLTQIEAQSWGVPVIASGNCGEVIEGGVNGRLLKHVTAETIEHAIRDIVQTPTILKHWRSNSRLSKQFSIAQLGARLNQLSECHHGP